MGKKQMVIGKIIIYRPGKPKQRTTTSETERTDNVTMTVNDEVGQI